MLKPCCLYNVDKMIAKSRNRAGFTLVELAVTIVVIAILATISVISYDGMQQRARDAKRKSDISSITEALDLYYLKNQRYPNGSGSTTINSSWSTTADDSWSDLAAALEPFLEEMPWDPVSSPGVPVTSSSSQGYNYAYFSNGAAYCGAAPRQMYILLYRLEGSAQTNTLIGDCPTMALGPYGGASNYRVVR